MRSRKLLLRYHVLTTAVLLLVLGCSSQYRTASSEPPASASTSTSSPMATAVAPSSSGTAPAQASAPQEVKIDIVGFAFSPKEVTVAVGTKVTWTMRDRNVPHTVTLDSPSSGVAFNQRMETGTTFSHTFNTSGVFKYSCTVHPTMHGTISVGDAKQSDLPQQPAQSTPADPYYQSGY